ncbi:Leucine rich repeat family protein [Candida parapsilosis]|uniref:Uncharacterized protein n=2 Tax=Candida parapsilosis TaxID=5480 RepID=G8BDA8_CANPC|nr:uncharacterized protein CPAR2_209000 [Candida parapsilosis]KAF6054596.1 Leucine rich repeat family protein [Candida parapsilosis]KAF6056378.1 Leucine rich repeat family protein [Candida parapsilosis]KAF6059312.1 Leucine rich repeat family protein [Candida parapsilosis]KAF6068068.1 Leucine rich repeat family protein [Candida parapsilosis]KAI5904039.1 hypothetical protein K4G60_g3197 [Candida parapsilosis]
MTGHKINHRLVVMTDSSKHYDKDRFVDDLKEMKNTEVTTIEIEKIDKDKLEFPDDFEYIHLLVQCEEKKWDQLTKFIDFLKKNPNLLTDKTSVGCHILFKSDKCWKDYSAAQVKQYKQFMSSLQEICGNKVTHLSFIDKFDFEDDDKPQVDAEIKSDIEPWENLEKLDYIHCCVEEFPEIKFPKTLEALNINGDYFLSSLDNFKFPNKLKSFQASSGALAYINRVYFPNALETLILSGNKMYVLDGISFPKSLINLDVSENRIDSLAGARWPPKLESLSIACNPIETLKGVVFPPSLKILDAGSIPNDAMVGVKFPESLEVLNLQSAMTTPRGLKVPPNVKTLVLTGDGVSSVNSLKLPDGIETLYLNENKIKTLNKVQFPSNLKELYLGDNLLTTLKNVVFPDSLETLDIENEPGCMSSEKQIITLKDVILPPKLKVLKLGYQGIRILENYEFPDSLTYLSLPYNDMKSIRSVKFGNDLKKLDLSGNPELLSLENVKIPESVTELRIPEEMVPNLPADIVDRANKGSLVLKKIHTDLSAYDTPIDLESSGIITSDEISGILAKKKEERIARYEKAE